MFLLATTCREFATGSLWNLLRWLSKTSATAFARIRCFQVICSIHDATDERSTTPAIDGSIEMVSRWALFCSASARCLTTLRIPRTLVRRRLARSTERVKDSLPAASLQGGVCQARHTKASLAPLEKRRSFLRQEQVAFVGQTYRANALSLRGVRPICHFDSWMHTHEVFLRRARSLAHSGLSSPCTSGTSCGPVMEWAFAFSMPSFLRKDSNIFSQLGAAVQSLSSDARTPLQMVSDPAILDDGVPPWSKSKKMYLR